MPELRRIRDLSLLDLPGELVLISACDSIGAIGAKELDVVKVSGYFVGRAAVRVPLMEILATGAKPVALYNTLTVEREPSGEEIIQGIAHELELAGTEPDLIMNGSTEENVTTRQTGVGVVVQGLATKKDLLIGKAQKGDLVMAFGLPKVGVEVAEGGPDDPEVAKPALIKELLRWGQVHELLPIGSKGVLYECRELARTAKLNFKLNPKTTIDINKSAGPATCLLAAISAEALESLQKIELSVPWQIVGRLI